MSFGGKVTFETLQELLTWLDDLGASDQTQELREELLHLATEVRRSAGQVVKTFILETPDCEFIFSGSKRGEWEHEEMARPSATGERWRIEYAQPVNPVESKAVAVLRCIYDLAMPFAEEPDLLFWNETERLRLESVMMAFIAARDTQQIRDAQSKGGRQKSANLRAGLQQRNLRIRRRAAELLGAGYERREIVGRLSRREWQWEGGRDNNLITRRLSPKQIRRIIGKETDMC